MKKCSICKQILPLERFVNVQRNANDKESRCKECATERAKKYYIENREYLLRYRKDYYNKKRRKRRRIKRLTVLEHYGGKCACCGESRYEFLCIDHINGGGTIHRKNIRKKTNMISYLISNNFPSGYRILCHNCNMALGLYGHCPHDRNFK